RVSCLTSQLTQSKCCHMRLPHPRRLKLGTKGRDQQNREALDLFHSDIKQVARGRVGPMEILKDHQYRLAATQTSELSQQRLERLLLFALRRQIERGVAPIRRHR